MKTKVVLLRDENGSYYGLCTMIEGAYALKGYSSYEQMRDELMPFIIGYGKSTSIKQDLERADGIIIEAESFAEVEQYIISTEMSFKSYKNFTFGGVPMHSSIIEHEHKSLNEFLDSSYEIVKKHIEVAKVAEKATPQHHHLN